MNIFKYYEQLFKKIIKANTNLLGVNNISSIKNLTVETPPPNYNFDISSNAAMILAKENKLNPKLVAEKLIKILKENIVNLKKANIMYNELYLKLLKRGFLFSFLSESFNALNGIAPPCCFSNLFNLFSIYIIT